MIDQRISSNSRIEVDFLADRSTSIRSAEMGASVQPSPPGRHLRCMLSFARVDQAHPLAGVASIHTRESPDKNQQSADGDGLSSMLEPGQ